MTTTVIFVDEQASVTKITALFASIGGTAVLSYGTGQIEFDDGSRTRIMTPENLENKLCGVMVDSLLISDDIPTKVQQAIIYEIGHCLTREFKEVQYF